MRARWLLFQRPKEFFLFKDKFIVTLHQDIVATKEITCKKLKSITTH